MFGDDPIDRRSFVKRAGAITLGSVALAGCSGDGGDGSGGDGGGNGGGSSPTSENGNGGGSSSDFGGWLSSANNYSGSVTDKTGSDQVTIKVGAGNGLAFGPAAVRVSTGTEVRWEWTGQGGQHNVHAKEGASFDSDLYSDSGVHFTHTFEESGTVKYQCDPHATVGMKGVVVVE